ncbi:2-polyprenyl-6-methoxyphenol hydroxylase [Bradyrhizobium sp. NFR13]|uniref:FAD-dependent oxidoreductase n=1 Tax=Bradyrhizobium sp. NFR13 TaxID=1566285 RepID=UPI0008EB4ACB|nr:NAD(P)/FAD-dependent oxidoreductase [Bradyrhizobium sp. NFR13]SFL24616.1 2-polyprenyl-6-methoxyphenol hydroxylase [Bradyrhizobium sp. NFR13]
MRQTDIAIIGGGLAGSTAAAMLGRAGMSAILIEPHQVHPPELRCEKISGGVQLERLRKTGLVDAVLGAATHDDEIWIARFGRVIDKRPSQQHGFLYDTLVNTVRGEIPSSIEIIHAKATSIATSDDRQTVGLSNGEKISARLVILANGASVSLRNQLNIGRPVISANHSISVGFDIAPVNRARFAFPALTYFAETTVHRTAYVTLFPIGDTMRGNLFVYRETDDPWIRKMRRTPEAALDACLPKLRALIGDYKISGDIRIRPIDLYESDNVVQPGVVLVGDAFASPCPGSGCGTDKVFTDVAQLCSIHIPNWLATDGMSADKIAQYYADPLKLECDAWATGKAFKLRSVTIENSLYWRAQRWARFFGRLGEGMVRRTRETLPRELAMITSALVMMIDSAI